MLMILAAEMMEKVVKKKARRLKNPVDDAKPDAKTPVKKKTPKRKKKMYFGKEAHAAVVKYQLK